MGHYLELFYRFAKGFGADVSPARARLLVTAAGCARDLRSAFSLLALVKRGAERRKAQGFAAP